MLLAGTASAQSSASRPVPVRAVAVSTSGSVRTSVQPATVHPYHLAEIRPRVSGYVDQVHVDIGQVVSEGDPLAVISVPELQSRRATLEAQCDRLRAEEQQAAAGISLAEAELDSARAMVEQARSDVDRIEASVAASRAEFERTRDLVSRQSVEARLLDEARKRLDADLASRKMVQSSIVSAEAKVRVAEAKRKSAEADLQAAEASTRVAERQLEELLVKIDFATVRAPFSGVVTRRQVDPGDLVDPADRQAEPLLTVSHVDRVRIHVPVPERDAPLVNVGDKMDLSFPSFPAERVSAEVTRLTQSLDASTRMMLVEAEVDNRDGKLIPGMFGQASIILSVDRNAKTLPARAIRFDSSGAAFVYALRPDDTVQRRDVTLGNDDGKRIQIVSGLDAGERVVDAHRQRFVDGQRVSVIDEPAAVAD